MLHPITFSIPECKIVRSVPNKTKIISNLIPGNISTYIYQTEEDYYKEYQSSLFALTTKKAGWDCMRHYEIIANGCIPYFPNIEKCPINTMALLPKDLILQGNTLYATYKDKNITDLKKEDLDICFDLIKKLLEFIKNNLTTANIASYILNKSNHKTSVKILFLSGQTSPDYLRCLTLHGFKVLLGDRCHDFPKVPHIYKSDQLQYNKLYGKGITYTNNLDQSLHDISRDHTIENDIRNKYYDIIVYGSYHRGMPYYGVVSQIYDPSEIILLCGEDLHACNNDIFVKKGHTVFVREL